jgi:hypothetical protein
MCWTLSILHPFVPSQGKGRHEGVWGSGCIDENFLDLGIS